MKWMTSKFSRAKKVKKEEKTSNKKDEAFESEQAAKKRKKVEKDKAITNPPAPISLPEEKQIVEDSKFAAVEQVFIPQAKQEAAAYNLPVRYEDNRIVLLPRDPWWMHTYWDISEAKINEVITAIPVYERQNLKWILRVYNVTGVNEFHGDNANSFFDIDITFEARNWYINVNDTENEWCVEIGLRNPFGKFFPVVRSNVIKTPHFGISSVIDEQWALPDEDYFKLFKAAYDVGRSSLENVQKLEKLIEQQISSPLASWGISSFSGQRPRQEEDFFLEVWTELILYGRTKPDADVTVEGKKIQLRADGTFTVRYALPPGDFKYEVKALSKNKKHRRKAIPAVKRYNR